MTRYRTIKRLLHILAILFVIYNVIILLRGNNLDSDSRSRTIWINPPGKKLTTSSPVSKSISRLLVDRLQRSSINSELGSKRLTYSLSSNNISQTIALLQNKIDISTLNRTTHSVSKLNVDYPKDDDLTVTDIGTSLRHNNTRSVSRHLSSGKEDDVTNGSSEVTLVNDTNIEDENNEFDITDLDNHIYFNIEEKEEKKNDSHIKQQSDREIYKWNAQYDIKLNNSQEYRYKVYKIFKRPIQNAAGIDCHQVVDHNEKEIAKAKFIMGKIPRRQIDTDKYARTRDCQNFRGGRGYIEHPLSQMELDFPLAFGLTVYRDVEQAERLLRSIYRPHNFYCFHLDSKMRQIERRAFNRIASCLDNVFIADKSLNVTWGKFSVLEAELLCMEKLLQHKRWKYYINLTGQEFPLKTNREIVAILKSLDGANIVDGTWIRATHRYFYRWTVAGKPPPHKIRPIKGSIHVAVNRHFVNYAIYNQTALDFLDWLKKTEIPDETFFASLNHNPHLGINGSFLGDPEEYPLKPSLMRYKNWELGHSVYVRGCAGKYVRHICVLGIGDLNRAYNDIGLFVNKFNIDFEYLAFDCLEEILYQKTWNQYIDDTQIDTNYYEHLDYVKKKLFVPPSAG